MFFSAIVLAGTRDGVHMGHAMGLGNNRAGGQLGITAQAIGVARIARLLTGSHRSIPKLRITVMVVGINGGTDGGKLPGGGGICVELTALGAGPVFHVALLVAGGSYGVHVGQIVDMGIVSVNLKKELTAQAGAVKACDIGSTHLVRNGKNVLPNPRCKRIRITCYINAGKEVSGVQKAAEGINVAALDFAALNGEVVGGGGGAVGKRVDLLRDGVVLTQRLGGHIEIGVVFVVVVLVVPGHVHVVIRTVDLYQIPCVILALAFAGHHVGGNAGLLQQILEGTGIALADRSAFHQSAVGVMGVRGGEVIRHMADQVVVKVQLDLKLTHVVRNAGECISGGGIKLGLSRSQFIAGESIGELNGGQIIAGKEAGGSFPQPKMLGIIVAIDIQYGLEVVDIKGMIGVHKRDALLAGLNAGLQGVVCPGKVLAVFQGGDGRRAVALIGRRSERLGGYEGQHHDQGDNERCQSLRFCGIHGVLLSVFS